MEDYFPNTWKIIFQIHGRLFSKYMEDYFPNTWKIIFQIHGRLFSKYTEDYFPNTWKTFIPDLKSHAYRVLKEMLSNPYSQ